MEYLNSQRTNSSLDATDYIKWIGKKVKSTLNMTNSFGDESDAFHTTFLPVFFLTLSISIMSNPIADNIVYCTSPIYSLRPAYTNTYCSIKGLFTYDEGEKQHINYLPLVSYIPIIFALVYYYTDRFLWCLIGRKHKDKIVSSALLTKFLYRRYLSDLVSRKDLGVSGTLKTLKGSQESYKLLFKRLWTFSRSTHDESTLFLANIFPKISYILIDIIALLLIFGFSRNDSIINDVGNLELIPMQAFCAAKTRFYNKEVMSDERKYVNDEDQFAELTCTIPLARYFNFSANLAAIVLCIGTVFHIIQVLVVSIVYCNWRRIGGGYGLIYFFNSIIPSFVTRLSIELAFGSGTLNFEDENLQQNQNGSSASRLYSNSGSKKTANNKSLSKSQMSIGDQNLLYDQNKIAAEPQNHSSQLGVENRYVDNLYDNFEYYGIEASDGEMKQIVDVEKVVNIDVEKSSLNSSLRT